ncbi:MAG: DUF4199 domain-containing protein [Cyclobacteriaceae bacterium]|nr:MAG: DUF4199 domain-containing protein [Cyclobacteriaceae bacterium]
MRKPSPLFTIAVRYGAIAAVLSIALNMAMFYMNRHPVMISPYLDFRIFLYGIFIFFSLKEYRDFHNEGALHFFQGMFGSFVLVATAGVLGSILYRIFGAFETNFIPEYVRLMTEYLKGWPEEDIARVGKETFERNLQSLPSTNMGQIATMYLVQSFGIGLFVSIIMSVILRKQPKP